MGQPAKKFENVKFTADKEFQKSLQALYQRGGKWQKKANKVRSVLGSFDSWNRRDDKRIYPLDGLSLTNHGESRIDHCLKYDLNDGVRLITIQDNGVCVLVFVGDHDQCDNWIEKNRQYRLSVDDNKRLSRVYKSKSIKDPDNRIASESDYSLGSLYEKLSSRYFEPIFEELPPFVVNGLKGLDSTFDANELLDICEVIESIKPEMADTVMDVFTLLKKGDVEQAKRRIDLYKNKLTLVEELEEKEISEIEVSDEFFDFEDFEPEVLEHFLKTAGFKEWMIFLHPEQRKIVNHNFNGPAKLAGVSGSGKTAIIVKRAIRLAKLYPDDKILIVTLNKALANLIKELINTACPHQGTRERIEIKSLWKLCKDELLEFENDIEKRFNEFTWKHDESVDEIWDEFYFCEKNNKDADVFYPVHQSILARNVNARLYIKQEFDWIRSAFEPEERENKYLEIDREGRSEPLTSDFRELMLKGLDGWEDKMEAIGVVDYTGLAARLHKYKDQLKEKYRCILVDELQDFGTMELALLRRLVPETENDMFLCGDIAQQVHTKHHKITHAGINIIGRSQKIKQNYRNSREILRAAYEVLRSNVDIDNVRTDDFEIIEPEFANFSTPKPLLISAGSLKEELGYALSYVTEYLTTGKKACIAIAGLSLHQIKKIGEDLDIDVLDNVSKIDSEYIFLSDLDQTKGFEFDMMFVLNCTDKVIPDPSLPEAEWHRDICKLYVAMTRAKKELFVSYHHRASSLFKGIEDHFVADDWSEQIEIYEPFQDINITRRNRFTFDKKKDSLNLTGRDFLYTNHCIGLSVDVQDKLLELVTGKNASKNKKKTQWPTIYELYTDRDVPNVSRMMGPSVYKKFKDHIDENL